MLSGDKVSAAPNSRAGRIRPASVTTMACAPEARISSGVFAVSICRGRMSSAATCGVPRR
jgi:hypothetical protein